MDILEVTGKIVKYFPNFIKDWMGNVVFQDNIEQLPAHANATNVLVVLGGHPGRVEHALELYEQGYADYVLVTGGIGPFSEDQETPEAEIMADELVEFGVPEDRIWIENRAVNTLENVQYSMPILVNEAFKHLNHRLQPIIITSPYHLKRACALFKKELRKVHRQSPLMCSVFKTIFWSASSSRFGRKSWKRSVLGCGLVTKEFFRIAEYRLLGKM